MNKVDDFFKRKLEATAIEPRAEAWAKLEANLSKKNRGLIWLRAAASLLLAGMLITFIMWFQNKVGKQQMAEKLKKEIPATPRDGSPTKTDNITQSPQEENKSIAEGNKTNKKEKKAPKQMTSGTSIKEVESDRITINSSEQETIETETVAVVVDKPIVIEFTLESVKYLKKDVVVLAETTEKKNNLQKALDFAREAKNSDSPLGELRQAKDDLFALNFKKDKQKKQ